MKTVLIDLRNINNPASGFGQIAINYAKHFAELNLSDMEFVFLVPEHCNYSFSDKVKCIPFTKAMKHNSKLLPKVDLWHSVNQQLKKQRKDEGSRLILTIHDLNWLREKNWIRQLKHKIVLQRKINRADAVTTISKFVNDEVKQHFSLKGKPLQVIYNGIERIDLKPQQKPSFVTDDKPFFFTIGQIRMKKNFHLLLDVMKSFPDYQLYIAGDDHFSAAELIRRRIHDEHITNVHLVGKVFDPERVWLYAHCEAFLFPSQGEGFGLPVIEAMQMGRAVFVAPFTCLPEIAGGKAFVFDDVRTETMVNCIKTNLPHYYDNAEHIEEVKQYALSFSYERHIEQYVELYRKLLYK